MALLRIIIILVWLVAISYGIPSLIVYDTIDMMDGEREVSYCFNMGGINLKVMIHINFILWYCIPLILMSVMYTKISIVLWKSSLFIGGSNNNKRNLTKMTQSTTEDTCLTEMHEVATPQHRLTNTVENNCETTGKKLNGVKLQQTNGLHNHNVGPESEPLQQTGTGNITPSTNKKLKTTCSTQNALQTRRKVIRLLVSIVVSFAVCMLPHHLRLLYEMWAPHAYHPSFAQQLIPPTTFLFFYTNSALNPILYAFLSDNFRKSLKEAFGCKSKSSPRMMNMSTNLTKDTTTVRPSL